MLGMIENIIEEMSEWWKNIMKKIYRGADTKKGMTYRGKHVNPRGYWTVKPEYLVGWLVGSMGSLKKSSMDFFLQLFWIISVVKTK